MPVPPSAGCLLLQSLLDPSVIWIFIPLTALAIPIFGILVSPYKARLQKIERDEARKTYERLALEKLEVIKTALTMGYQKADLDDLDQRLERLIGSDKLQGLLDPKQPQVPAARTELLESELDEEIDKLTRKKLKE